MALSVDSFELLYDIFLYDNAKLLVQPSA